jgi:hypothetical protein
MDQVPGNDEQQRLLEAIDELIEARGPAAYLASPILLPETRFFPDPFSPDVGGVYLLARRLMAYAGLAGLQVAVQSFSEDQPPPLRGSGTITHSHPGVAAWFAGIVDGVCLFGVREDELESAERLVAAMAHEVCHAYRAHHGLCVPDAAEEERLTDLTSSYLGFGVLTLNASYLYRSSGYTDGRQTVTTWSHSQLGYLSPQALAFLLALQLEVRRIDGGAARQVLAEVETNQASYVRESRRLLAARFQGDALLEELGLPARDAWPAAVSLETALAAWNSETEVGELREAALRQRALETGELPPELEAEHQGAGAEAEAQAGPRIAVRLPVSHEWSGLFLGLGTGVLIGYLIGSLDYLTAGLTLWLTYAGWKMGRRIVLLRCSSCRGRVLAGADACPGCSCRLLESWPGDAEDDELAREAEEAGRELEARRHQE